MKVDVDFGQFLPDRPSYKNPGLTKCDNVYAVGAGYNPIAGLVGTGRNVTGEVRGVARFDLPDGTPLLLVGTTTDLFVMRGKSVFASGLNLALGFGDYWAFDQLGHSLYATCKTHGLYRLASIFSDSAFVANSGYPPKASTLDVVGDFLFLGNLIDIDASNQPYRVRWSAFNNPTADWVTDIGRQSGYVDMESRYGEVTGIFGGRFDLIFQRTGISRIWFTGGPTVFAKEVIEAERGCPAPNSLVRVGGDIYFLAHDGFCRTDGSGVEIISSDRVWQWFKDNLNTGFLKFTQGAVDWANRSIIWSFYPTGFEGYQRQIIYNWGLDRWTTASVTVDWIAESTTLPVSIDETDPTVLNDNILDVNGPSFDSAQYEAQGRTLAAFVNGELQEFKGDNMLATFETGDYQPQVGARSFIRSVFPIVRLPSRNARASIAGRDTVGEDKIFGPQSEQGPLGFCPAISDAWFHSVRIEIPSGVPWSKASGFQIDWEASGAA